MNPWVSKQLQEILPRIQSLAFDLQTVWNKNGEFTPKEFSALSYPAIDVRTIPCLDGRMSGHPNIRDGHLGRTSEIFYVSEKRRFVRTLSRWYMLDTPLSGEAAARAGLVFR
ncbi:hypothetical protein QA648_27870 (plasmid) [Rhizobium sp. CB3171]|uniref:hypothetical protein n=1 Tax=Rhizobium sp. CB3171 TaxID=3039157 RepID=UPI0024B07F99|nr:hypothetical protein [Rhizobium sp. CB3171]WFU04595.1 hypothetical protein QA648_27870 [Rhizobium sp. CB3171]